MTGWTTDELSRIEGAEELEIAPVRRNGELRRRTTIWVVRTGDDLYVRAAVTIEDADDETVLDRVDAAYRQKYEGRYASIVESINDDEHRATTLRIAPREAG